MCGWIRVSNSIDMASASHSKAVAVPAPTQQGPRNRLCRAAGAAAPSGGSEPHEVGSVGAISPSRRAWQRFRRNRLGYWSLLLFCLLVVFSLFAEVLSND